MPKRKIQFYPGEFYHVFNRGNGKQDIFYDDKDRYRFLQSMYLSNNINSFLSAWELEKSKSGYTLANIQKILNDNEIIRDPLVKICADVLMPNHFHFLIQEIKNGGIPSFMQKLGGYVKYFAAKHKRPGGLFQGRFKAVHVKKDDQLKYLLAYINVINPAQLIEPNLKESGIKNLEKVFEFVDNYKWSTHFEYSGKRNSIITDKSLLGEIYPNPKIYIQFVKNILASKQKEFWPTIDGLSIE